MIKTPPAKSGSPSSPPRERRAGFRWTICALIFFATTVNYLDRQLFSLLIPFFESELRLGPTDLALINVSFVIPYGVAMIFVGQWIDRVGVGKGLGNSFLLWNVASMGHALVNSFSGFIGMRFLLGLGESGMFPAAVKTVTEWFPARERSLATGVFNAGANCGAILAPLLGVWLAATYGWRTCFVLTGLVGLIWIVFWNRLYRPPTEHPRVTPEELLIIQADGEPPTEKIGLAQLFSIRPIYGLAVAKALSDAPWWFYLTWMPKFLVDQFGLKPGFMALAIPVIYIVADVGSIAGGWASSRLIARGWDVGPARKLTMLVCAVLVLPVCVVGNLVGSGPIVGVPSVYWAVLIVAVAAGAHQGWSSNLFTLVSDTVPKRAVAVAVGGINGFAMVGVSAMQFFVGSYVQLTSSYTLPFIVAGTLYLVALVILQLWIPQVRPVAPGWPARMGLVALGAAVVLGGLGLMQYVLNRPPYGSLADYQAKRQIELRASAPPVVAAEAKVDWMAARWYVWQTPEGPKRELVKLDTAGRPFVEQKGADAPKYAGPRF